VGIIVGNSWQKMKLSFTTLLNLVSNLASLPKISSSLRENGIDNILSLPCLILKLTVKRFLHVMIDIPAHLLNLDPRG